MMMNFLEKVDESLKKGHVTYKLIAKEDLHSKRSDILSCCQCIC